MFERLRRRREPEPPIESNSIALKIIRMACERKVLGALVWPGFSAVAPVRFSTLLEDCFVASVVPKEHSVPIAPMLLCAVSFELEGKANIFQSRVYAIHPMWPSVRELTMDLPREILSASRRVAFRVPVDCADVTACVRPVDGSRVHSGRISDISVAGLKIRFASGAAEKLSVGQAVDIDVQWKGRDQLNLTGVVRHADANSCGIFFPSVVDGTDRKSVV